MKKGTGSCQGTFGELMQGMIDEQLQLVTFPIQLTSQATFTPCPEINEIIVTDRKLKAKKACEYALQLFQINCGGYLSIHSSIPIGKGMASSSADIVASIRALSDSFSLHIPPPLIATIAAKIEPTDGVMFDGIVSFDYLNGELIEQLGKLPPYCIVGLDTGYEVDTIIYNRKEKMYSDDEKQELKLAKKLIKAGILEQKLTLIQKGTTISSQINERFLPKPYFQEVNQLAKSLNAGLVIAHSGTMVGILMDPIGYQKIQDLKKQLELITNLEPFIITSVERKVPHII